MALYMSPLWPPLHLVSTAVHLPPGALPKQSPLGIQSAGPLPVAACWGPHLNTLYLMGRVMDYGQVTTLSCDSSFLILGERKLLLN